MYYYFNLVAISIPIRDGIARTIIITVELSMTLRQLTKKQRLKLAVWVGHEDVQDFEPDTNLEHATMVVEKLATVENQNKMFQLMQNAVSIAALKYLSSMSPQEKRNMYTTHNTFTTPQDL